MRDTQSHATYRLRCDQCKALMINGVFCHETGCPNTNARYDRETDTWIRQKQCFNCGCTVDVDDICCQSECFEPEFTYPEPEEEL